MRVFALSGIVIGTLLSAAPAAQADCGVPAWIGTETGTHVPTRGVVYLHDESIGSSTEIEPWLKVRWSGGEGTFRVTRVEESVASIEYEGPAGATLHVQGRYGNDVTELVLDDTWQAPAQPPRVLQYWRHQSEWTCSWSDSLMIQLDQPSAAIRVRWWVNDHHVDYVETVQVDGTKAVLELGKINCGGENMPLEQLQAGGGIQLFAIRSDGSEVLIPNMPSRVSLDALPPIESGLDHAFTIVATHEPHTTVNAAPKREPEGRGLGAIVLAFAGLGVIAGFWLLKRDETAASDC